MVGQGCAAKKISSFAEHKASLCEPLHPLGDKAWALSLVSAGSQTPRLSSPTLLDGSPLAFQAPQRPPCWKIACRQAKTFCPRVDTVLKNPDIYVIPWARGQLIHSTRIFKISINRIWKTLKIQVKLILNYSRHGLLLDNICDYFFIQQIKVKILYRGKLSRSCRRVNKFARCHMQARQQYRTGNRLESLL